MNARNTVREASNLLISDSPDFRMKEESPDPNEGAVVNISPRNNRLNQLAFRLAQSRFGDGSVIVDEEDLEELGLGWREEAQGAVDPSSTER